MRKLRLSQRRHHRLSAWRFKTAKSVFHCHSEGLQRDSVSLPSLDHQLAAASACSCTVVEGRSSRRKPTRHAHWLTRGFQPRPFGCQPAVLTTTPPGHSLHVSTKLSDKSDISHAGKRLWQLKDSAHWRDSQTFSSLTDGKCVDLFFLLEKHWDESYTGTLRMHKWRKRKRVMSPVRCIRMFYFCQPPPWYQFSNYPFINRCFIGLFGGLFHVKNRLPVNILFPQLWMCLLSLWGWLHKTSLHSPGRNLEDAKT